MKKQLIYSFVFGGLAGGIIIAVLLFAMPNMDGFISALVLGIPTFTYVSCMILGNNFIQDVSESIFSWGFVSLPGIIFELDLDGIIWMLTVKLLFWILGLVLAIICGILAIIVGGILSVFTYPFALVKHIREG